MTCNLRHPMGLRHPVVYARKRAPFTRSRALVSYIHMRNMYMLPVLKGPFWVEGQCCDCCIYVQCTHANEPYLQAKETHVTYIYIVIYIRSRCEKKTCVWVEGQFSDCFNICVMHVRKSALITRQRTLFDMRIHIIYIHVHRSEQGIFGWKDNALIVFICRHMCFLKCPIVLYLCVCAHARTCGCVCGCVRVLVCE